MDIDLTACIQGDSEAWNQFCVETGGVIMAAIRRTARTQLADPSLPDPEDILQAVYLRLINNEFKLLRSFDPGRASLSTWLSLITRSITIDVLRRRRLPNLPLQESDAVTARDEAAGSSRLEDAAPLNTLTSRQRLVLTLLFEDNRTVPEAAQFLGVGEQTIRSTKHKALERLRKAMRPQGIRDDE